MDNTITVPIDASSNPHKDLWHWCAVYQGGETIKEFDIPEGRGFKDVDVEKTTVMRLESEYMPTYVAKVPQWAKAVFFRRRYIHFDTVTNAQVTYTAHCIGWEALSGRASYMFVLENGDVILSEDKEVI